MQLVGGEGRETGQKQRVRLLPIITSVCEYKPLRNVFSTFLKRGSNSVPTLVPRKVSHECIFHYLILNVKNFARLTNKYDFSNTSHNQY